MFTRNLSRGLSKLNQTPIKSYNNAAKLKSLIFKDNIGKCFIYRWTNKINGKTYIGRTANAKSRLTTYFKESGLKARNMPIYKALLKYGHSQFIFDIIEYCNPEDIVQREQFYLDNFDFDYNIRNKALGPFIRRHRSETIELLRKASTNKKHSEENCKKMREGWVDRRFYKDKVENKSKNTSVKKLRKQIIGKLVTVKNIDTNDLTKYLSISEAASALNITRNTLRSYVKNQRVLTFLKQEGNVLIKENFLITVTD